MKRENLIMYRGEKSRQEVAKDLNITPQMLGMLERGDRTPSLELAKRFQIIIKFLLKRFFLILKKRNVS